jgi:antitoxin CptB
MGAASEQQIKRLRWHCRRGTQELDALLGNWLTAHEADADGTQLAAFDAMLDRQDPALWDWLTGSARPPRRDWCQIVDEIRGYPGRAN